MILQSLNFREINKGKISPNTLYRSSHPIRNGMQVDDIILTANNAKIKTIINLSDDMSLLESKIENCSWYKEIYEGDNVITLDMGYDILGDQFNEKIKCGLIFMIEHEPPYLIHCEAGMDRTGFLLIILESFMEMVFDDIVKDYMLSFIDEDEYTVKDYWTGSEFILNTFSLVKGELVNTHENIQELSTKYLREKIGLNENELEILKNKLINDRR